MKHHGDTEGATAAEPLLTTTEVARVLGVSRATAWVRVVRGDLPGRKVGGMFLVAAGDLERYRAQQQGTNGRARRRAS